MSDKIKEDLFKTVTYYYDIKLNCKYLIYFNKHQLVSSQSSQTQFSPANDSIFMLVTNGVDCWSTCINDEKFLTNIVKIQLNEKVSFIEFLSYLTAVLTSEQFELNKMLNNNHENAENTDVTDLIEIKFNINPNKSKNGDGILKCRILLEPILSARSKAFEIKNILFFLYQQYNKTDLELKKLKNNCNSNQTSETSNASSSSNGTSSLTRSNSNDMLRERFGIKKSNLSGNVARKPGMSIINPYSKRRKTPKGGITFDEDESETEDDESSQSQN